MTRLFVVNVLLGIPGIIYFWMLSLYISQGSILPAAGTSFAHNLEGYFSSNQVLGPPLAIGAIVWVLINVYLVNRRKRSGACQNASGKTAHWLTAFGSTLLLPVLLLATISLG
ncbi:hypothetical protein [Glutamicibacter sp. NPDC087344]|uniref:hypothetical protein n=1 Tax=Glutamicibacter sp. NPDC087344 TaxID=3363994 RepID=UPI0037FF1887